METTISEVEASPGLRASRVLVFSVDDGLFALHIDWVEAMLPRSAVTLHSVRDEGGHQQAFLLHAGEPAMVVDLRDVFALTALLGSTQRREILVVRSPSFLLALTVDTCVGIRDLDLERRPPVPSSLVRDGGLPVAHLVALDGKPVAVLDPSQLLDSATRDSLSPLVQRARDFEQRERKLESLWAEICAQPTETTVRTYARLCSRNGRTRTAAAARVVLRHLTGGGRLGDPGQQAEPPPADAWESPEVAAAQASAVALVESQVSPQERLIRELVCLAGESASGELIVPQKDGTEESRVFVANGRVVQTHHHGERGRLAFKQLLAVHPEHFYFVESTNEPGAQRISESAAALIIDTLEALGNERRGRRMSSAARPD